MIKVLSLIASVALFTSVSTSADASSIVVDSNSADYNIGEVVNSDRPLQLSADESVKLLNQSGETKTVTGPFSGVVEFNAGEGDSKVTAALSGLFSRNMASSVKLGAVRAATPYGQSEPLEGPLTIRLDRSGVYCVEKGREVRFVRDSSNETTIEFRQPYSSLNGNLSSGMTSFPIPDGLKTNVLTTVLLNGRTYDLDLVEVSSSNSAVERAALYAENGCDEQALAALR